MGSRGFQPLLLFWLFAPAPVSTARTGFSDLILRFDALPKDDRSR